MKKVKRIVKALEKAGVEIRDVHPLDDEIVIISLWAAVEVHVGRHVRVKRGGKNYETIYNERVREEDVVDCVTSLFERLREKAAKKMLRKAAA